MGINRADVLSWIIKNADQATTNGKARLQAEVDQLRGQVAPGSVATSIKTNGPTQAEQISAGMQSSFGSAAENLGFKDARNAIALNDVEFMQGALANAGRPAGFTDAIDFFNERLGGQGGGRTSPEMVEWRAKDDSFNSIVKEAESKGNRREGPKPHGFVGEGMFGQVKELAPGYVEKTTPPVVEWPPMSYDSPNAGALYDYRDFAQEAQVQKYLHGAHIAPDVNAFKVNPDGTTETVMPDLRDNFTMGNDAYNEVIRDAEGASSPEARAQAMARKAMMDVKRKQQEAIAVSKGVKLHDRHEGNVAFNNMTGRPMQLDFGMVEQVSGAQRDYDMGRRAVEGFYAAGLEEEAEIYEGILESALGKFNSSGDATDLHDMAQQGASLLHKIKKAPGNYTRAAVRHTGATDLFKDDYNIDYGDSIPF